MKETHRYKWFVAVALLCGVLALSSCAMLGRRTSLRTAVDTYATTLGILADYRAAGLLSDEAVVRIDEARVLVRAALDEWRECLETDQSVSAAIADWTAAMSVLIDERLAVEGGE